jgi:membrane protease YdiL (CAAX protease family)
MDTAERTPADVWLDQGAPRPGRAVGTILICLVVLMLAQVLFVALAAVGLFAVNAEALLAAGDINAVAVAAIGWLTKGPPFETMILLSYAGAFSLTLWLFLRLYTRWAKGTPAGLINGVGRFRWREAGLAAGLFGVVSLATFIPAQQFGILPAEDGVGLPDRPVWLWVGVLAILPAFVAMQILWEELAFRGALVQAAARRSRNTLWLVLIGGLPFGLVHITGLEEMLFAAMFGMVATWVSLRRGGIEMAVGAHFINNLIALVATDALTQPPGPFLEVNAALLGLALVPMASLAGLAWALPQDQAAADDPAVRAAPSD